MSKYSKCLQIILIIIGVLLFIVAIILISVRAFQNSRSQALLEELRDESANVLAIESQTDEEEIGGEIIEDISDPDIIKGNDEILIPESEIEDESTIQTDIYKDAVPNPYADIFLKNSDMAGWLVVPDTVIDYPIMWTPEDEEAYLYKNFNGKDDKNGCLILDTDSCVNPLTTNLIIHGHNMKSGAMFGNLTAYEKKEYYDNHKEIILYTKDYQHIYEVISVFRSQVYKKSDSTFKYYKFFQADTKEEFDDFYNNIKALSIYDTGVSAEFGDHFITLSTCTYHVERGRFVVVAKEIEPGDIYLPIEDQD